MNFSDSIQQSGGLVNYSPNGFYVAIAKAFDVKVSFKQAFYLAQDL